MKTLRDKGKKWSTCLIKISVENREVILEQIIENFPEFIEDTHLQIQYAKVPNKVDEKKSSPGKLEYKSGEW